MIRKKTTKFLTIFLGVIMMFQMTACSTKLQEPVYKDDKNILIGAWVAPRPGYINDQTYKDIADSGINHIYALYEDANGPDAKKALDAAQKNGIKYLVRDRGLGSIREEDFDLLPDAVKNYKDHPAFAGNLIADEPGANSFEQLGKLHEAYKKILPDKIFYINLFPTYSSLDQRNGRTYAEYIDEYIQKVKPDVFSYDHYPIMKTAEGTSITEDYLLNLEMVARATKKADIPFWVFIQAMGFGVSNRVPNENDIRWQVYSSMAFGAKGIQYFCYWTPSNDGVTVFDLAMVDPEGKKTDNYYNVQKVNKEIMSFDHIYLNYNWVDTAAYPKEDPPAYLYMQEPAQDIACLKDVESEYPIIVGYFEDANKNRAIMLVNYTDPGKKLNNSVKIKFNDVKGILEYPGDSQDPVKLKKGMGEFNLKPGEGKFILLLK